MIVYFKKTDKNAIAPSRGSKEAAGYDIHALGDHIVKAGETVFIPTGLCMEIPNGFCGLIFARSGIASKQGLRPANCVGVIDSDYRGEVKVALHNDSDEDREVKNGERIVQIVVTPYLYCTYEEVDELGETERGDGGFGSTGLGGDLSLSRKK